MRLLESDDLSVNLTTIFMKIVGFWSARNRFERCVRNITLTYTIIMLLFAVWLQTSALYYSWGDLSADLYIGCNALSVLMPFHKVIVLLVYKGDFFYLIEYMQEKFLHGEYDDYEKTLLDSCKRKCAFLICFFTFFTEATVASYIVSPIVSNIGRNESDRLLPFDMFVNGPVKMTPYYEIAFVLEVLALYHTAVAYFCFDNMLCIMNLHLAGQFRILQYRMANKIDLSWKRKEKSNEKSAMDSRCMARECYKTFKNYIRQHQALIAYCDKLEKVFSVIVLGQVLMFSLLICLDGYQILMEDSDFTRRLIFVCHITGCISQLLMFTYSCDCIIRESTKLATSIYSGPWTRLPATDSGRIMRKDLIVVVMRSNVPCCLTASGFFVVSLETYIKVLSTAASYFTLIKQRASGNTN